MMNEQQQRRILSWLEEDADDILGGDDEENETGVFPDQVSEHDTDSEPECDNDLHQVFSNYNESLEMPNEEHLSLRLVNESMEVLESAFSDGNEEPLINISSSNFYIVEKLERNGTSRIICKWRKTLYPQVARTRRHNIVTKQPGPQGAAYEVSSPLESWLPFLDINMLQHVVDCTNIKITYMQFNYERSRDAEHTNLIELKALISIMCLIEIRKASHTSVDDIWMADGTEIDKCRAVMSKQRFQFYKERSTVNKLAPIREIYESFVKNCDTCYKNNENVTLDEMLESFRGSAVANICLTNL
ncbi:unnamed protein product [Parnassius apollo]|uniref:(apollo) hypothetical protein n=1 Tax=Parnassius apollo TaxID=110799 RepID=A0A8S3WDT4_PARAO|nr:unnamed protein product [Parnassius apollo]